VHFYLPIATLHALADEAEAARVDELHYKPAISHADPILRSMAETLLPAFSRPEHANRLFMDHAMLAIGHRGLEAYRERFWGSLPSETAPVGSAPS
jgi:AraC family transcriptional regulator